MVKTIGSTLGYYVDGIQVIKPRKLATKPSGIRPRVNPNKRGDLSIKPPPQEQIYLIDLKNTVKQGQINNMLTVIGNHLNDKIWHSRRLKKTAGAMMMGSWATMMGSYNQHSSLFARTVRFLYSRNNELRIPLYFAALCGQVGPLRFIIAAYIMFAVRNFRKGAEVRLGDRKTFPQWCEYFDYWKGVFSRTDIQVSYLSALHDKVRFHLSREMFSVQDAAKILMSYNNVGGKTGRDAPLNTMSRRIVGLFESYGTETMAWIQVNQAKERAKKDIRRRKKPSIVIDDERVDYSEGSWWVEQEEEEEEDIMPRKPALLRRNSSAEVGKMILKRALSRGEGVNECAESDDFEIIDNSFEEGSEWEFVEAEEEEKEEGMGGGKVSYAEIASRGGVASSASPHIFYGIGRTRVARREKHDDKHHDEHDDDHGDFVNEVGDGLKGQRGRVKRGGDRHRGKGLHWKNAWNPPKWSERSGEKKFGME